MNKLKVKKYVFLIVALLLSVLCVAMLVACDEGEVPEDEGGYGDYETPTYSVSFNSNGGTDFSSFNYTATFGDKVTKPTSTPIKSGYTFAFWSKDGSTAFNFDTETVGGAITLKAIYNANIYTHTYDLSAVLTKDGDTYSVVTGQYNDASITSGAVLQSTYQSSSDKLAVPTTSKDADKFCFWYYLDSNNNPVQFSKWASSGDESVAVAAKYTFTKSLTLYPMWYSTLPKITVTFADGKAQDDNYSTLEMTLGDYLTAGEAPQFDLTSKAGYEFCEWYYIIEGDDEDVETTFVFDDVSSTTDTPTDLSTASGSTSVFEGGSLTLYARWTKLVSIASVQDFKNVKSVLEGDDQEAIDELLSAKIQIASIDFSSETLSPLFESGQVFVGTIDGATYDQNDNVAEKAVLSGGVFCGVSHVSVFGYVGGEIKNVDVDGISIFIDTNGEGEYAQSVSVGLLASVNTGVITNCSVTKSGLELKAGEVQDGVLKDGISKIVFGGVCAINAGEVRECRVDIDSVEVLCESLTFGGVIGESSKVSLQNEAKVEIVSILLASDDVSATQSTLKMGGIVGLGGGTIEKCIANLTVLALDADGSVSLGGVIGDSTGAVRISKAEFSLCTQQAPAIVAGAVQSPACIGGLVGKNGGSVANCMAQADVFVQAKKANATIIVGGLVGNNFNVSTSSNVGSIKTSYSTGSISVVVDDTLADVRVYAAGLVGRNSQTGISANFTLTTINVTNLNGTNNLGYVLGSMENTSTISSSWYVRDLSVTLNGYTYVDKDGEENPFSINTTGSSADLNTDFCDSTFVSDKLGYSVDVWDIVDGALPELKV